jgi:ubiquinone/menaquinone biosynthesis C-methylase UbiE
MGVMNTIEKFFVNSACMDLWHKYQGVSSLLRWSNITTATKVLDIGCGKGTTTKYIAKHFFHANITGLDIDEQQIQLASHLYPLPRIHYVLGNASKLHYKNETFDIIVAVMSFHHITNYDKAITETYRVLQKGGTLIIKEMQGPIHSPLKKKKFMHELTQAGFHIVKQKGTLFFSVVATK